MYLFNYEVTKNSMVIEIKVRVQPTANVNPKAVLAADYYRQSLIDNCILSPKPTSTIF